MIIFWGIIFIFITGCYSLDYDFYDTESNSDGTHVESDTDSSTNCTDIFLPTDKCIGDTLTVYINSDDGCGYTETKEHCLKGCLIMPSLDDVCINHCSGVTCDSPPVSYCVGLKLLSWDPCAIGDCVETDVGFACDYGLPDEEINKCR